MVRDRSKKTSTAKLKSAFVPASEKPMRRQSVVTPLVGVKGSRIALRPYRHLAVKLQVLGGYASLMDEKREKLVSDSSKLLLKILETTINECEEYLNFKIA